MRVRILDGFHRQLLMNGYLLALATLTLIGGALADAHGKVRMMAIGCLICSARCRLPAPSQLRSAG
jgi:MFS family permease